MPYVYDPNLEEDKDQEGVASGTPKLAGGSSSNEAPVASGAAPAQQQEKELNTGSGFQNLDKYLKTNQSQEFGQQVLGKVGDTLNTAKDNQANAAQNFQNKVQSANYTPDQGKVDQALANPGEANAKDFQKWMSQSYEGPKSLADNQDSWNQYWSGTNQAQAQSKALGSEAGRFSLLDSYFGRPEYNFGEKSLDNLLVQQSGTGKEARNLQNQAAQLKSQGDLQARNLQGVAAQRAGQVEQSRNQVNQAFGQAQSAAQGDVQNTVAQAQTKRAADQAAVQQAIASGQLTNAQLASLGLQRGQKVFDVDLGKYLGLNQNPIAAEEVATGDQRARLNALSQLAGQEQSYLGAQIDPSQAYGFDTGSFQRDLGARQGAYNSEIQAIDANTQNNINLMRPGSSFRDNTTGQTYSGQALIDYYRAQGEKQKQPINQKYNSGRVL
jgi:hypothetical protein